MGGTACWMSPSRPPSDQRNLRRSSRAHWRRCHPSKSSCTRLQFERGHIRRRFLQENTARASLPRSQTGTQAGCASSISGALRARLFCKPSTLLPTRSCAAKTCLSFLSVDRLKCEVSRSDLRSLRATGLQLMQPRFRSDREDWVQRGRRYGHAICTFFRNDRPPCKRPRHSADRRICLGARSRDRDGIRLHGNGRDTEHRAAGGSVRVELNHRREALPLWKLHAPRIGIIQGALR